MVLQAEQLKEINLMNARAGLEIRMPLMLSQIERGDNLFYEIRDASYILPTYGGRIATLNVMGVSSEPCFIFEDTLCRPLSLKYEVLRCLTRYGSEEIVGFASTLESAEKFAHDEAVSLAKQISELNGNIPVKDFSQKDIKDLEMVSKMAHKKNASVNNKLRFWGR